MDINDVKAGDYELVAELFDQPTSEPGDKVFLFKRYVRGDIVTLGEEEAKRLVAAGAVIEPGAREQAAYELALAAYEAALAALPQKPAGPDDQVAFPDGDPVEAWTLEQLKAYAEAKSIDLGDAKLKADVFGKIIPKG